MSDRIVAPPTEYKDLAPIILLALCVFPLMIAVYLAWPLGPADSVTESSITNLRYVLVLICFSLAMIGAVVVTLGRKTYLAVLRIEARLDKNCSQ